MHTTHHCHGCVSRRQCLKWIAAATASLSFAGEGFTRLARAAQPDPEFVDPRKLRPCPRVAIEAAFLQLPRPYWLGWPGTAYDLDRHQAEYRAKLRESAQKLGLDVRLEEKPIQEEAQMTAWIKAVRDRKPHGILVMLQHMSCWGWANRVAEEAGIPLIIFAPVGTTFTGHLAGISRRAGVYAVSSLEWPAVEDGLRMVRAKRMFEESRILWIHSDKRNETVLERLGTKVRAIPRNTFNELFDRMPENGEVRELAAAMRLGAERIVEPNVQDTLNSARAYTTAKRLLADEQAHALSMDCLGMVASRLVPTPPCGAWMLLQDQGITAGCEADLFGATSMMLTSYLLDRPGYMNDPVPETAKNLLIVSHCTSGARLEGFQKAPAPYILRSHSESDLGVAVQVLWPEKAPTTLVRFTSAHELIVDTGKVVSNVDTPPAGGCRTSVEVAMDRVEDSRDVLGFHQVVTLGNHLRILEGFAQLYGIKVIHSPEKTKHGIA